MNLTEINSIKDQVAQKHGYKNFYLAYASSFTNSAIIDSIVSEAMHLYAESQKPKWISVKDELPKDDQKVIVWQENLADAESSRHHCAIYYNGNDGDSFQIYPTVFRARYTSKKNYEDYDLEGDKCRLTHWQPLPTPLAT